MSMQKSKTFNCATYGVEVYKPRERNALAIALGVLAIHTVGMLILIAST